MAKKDPHVEKLAQGLANLGRHLEGFTSVEDVRRVVLKGSIDLSRRVLLTALVKGNPQLHELVLNEINRDHFSPVFQTSFDWIIEMRQTLGTVEGEELRKKAEAHEWGEWALMDGRPVVNHILAIETPERDVVEKAIESSKAAFEFHKKQVERHVRRSRSTDS